MVIYVVLLEKANVDLASKIAKQFPDDAHFEITSTQWLVATDKINNDLTKELGLTDGQTGVRGVIFRLANTGAGWHKKTLWEWLATKSEA